MKNPYFSSTALAGLFGLPRFATIFSYTALVVLSLPLIIVKNVGEHSKGLHLGLITGGGALLSVGAVYFFGLYRDRKNRIHQGFRYPIYSLALSFPALIIISLTKNYPVLIIAFLVLIISRAICESSHLAILTDQPDLENREHYTAGIAFWHFLGSGLAAVAFGFFPNPQSIFGIKLNSGLGIVAASIALVSIFGFYSIYSCQGKTHLLRNDGEDQRVRFYMPKNLMYLILARFFFLAGILMVSTFLVFVVRDYIGAADVHKTTALLYTGSIVGALAASLPSGKIVQRFGEIPVLFFSGMTLASVTAVFFLLGPVFPLLQFPCMFLYGAAVSGVISAGLSLTVKLIPHPQLSGRMMALLTAATFLSQSLASISGALILDPLNRLQSNLGYFGLLAVLELYLILGGIFLFRIKALMPEHRTVHPIF
ncbi:MAG: hypothetical protein GF421_09635 [Candidatus Aminicenantes bacterium]|nr:hypothetical protein [Candidatus Aminicenantes bacterium]